MKSLSAKLLEGAAPPTGKPQIKRFIVHVQQDGYESFYYSEQPQEGFAPVAVNCADYEDFKALLQEMPGVIRDYSSSPEVWEFTWESELSPDEEDRGLAYVPSSFMTCADPDAGLSA